MLHKALPQPRTQPSIQNRQPRVTHTPGAYPPLQPRNDAGNPLSVVQAAQILAGQSSTEPEKNMTTRRPAPESDADRGSRLIVGPNVKLKGADILDCTMLVVEGRVEATMDSHIIRIAEQGTYCGKVEVDVAEIHGLFEGELTARRQLVIHATGRVMGTIRYGSLHIEAGGQISGDIQALEQLRSGEPVNPGKEVDRPKVTSLISSVA